MSIKLFFAILFIFAAVSNKQLTCLSLLIHKSSVTFNLNLTPHRFFSFQFPKITLFAKEWKEIFQFYMSE